MIETKEQVDKTEDVAATEDIKITKNVKSKSKILIAGVIIALLIAGVWFAIWTNGENQITTITKSTLQKVVEINELSTVDYTYNATVTKYDEDKEVYHVAYEGTVTAGIDFNEINIEVFEKEKKVVITVPEIEIHSTKVNMGTMKYIFIEGKYDENTIAQETYKLCKEDLKQRIEKEEALFTTAKENAVSSVEALFKPWIESVDGNYSVMVQ